MLDTLFFNNQLQKLIPVDEATKQTGIPLSQLEKLIIAPVPGRHLWMDKPRTEQIISRLMTSVPNVSTVDQLPNLPDQLAVLLRAEITGLTDFYELTPEEKDWIEQHLQNILRPVVYKIIERHFSQQNTASETEIAKQILAESAVMSWQNANFDHWHIQVIDTVLGAFAFKLQADETVIFCQVPIYPELSFFCLLLEKFCAKLDIIRLT